MGNKDLPIKAKSPDKTEAINADRALPIHLVYSIGPSSKKINFEFGSTQTKSKNSPTWFTQLDQSVLSEAF